MLELVLIEEKLYDVTSLNKNNSIKPIKPLNTFYFKLFKY